MGREGRLYAVPTEPTSSARVSREVLRVDFCMGGQGRFVVVNDVAVE